jgi:hypothetical protein
MEAADDFVSIANRYNLSASDIKRAKDHAFGSGVTKYGFRPDGGMAAAWKRISQGTPTDVDEIFLRHEILESQLVAQGYTQGQAHLVADQNMVGQKH